MDGVQPPPTPPHVDPAPNGPPEPEWRREFDVNKRMIFAQHMLQKLFAVYPGCSESTLRTRTSQYESHAYQSAINRGQYLEHIANRISEAQLQMGVNLPVSSSTSTAVTNAPNHPTQQQTATVPQYSPNSHSVSNTSNPHIQVSSAITNSINRNPPPTSRGRGRPPRARGRQVRSNPTVRPAYNPTAPNSTNPQSAAASVAVAAQPGGMISGEELMKLQRQHQQQTMVNRHQQAMVNRQQQQQAMVNRQQQQQAMVNRQQQQQAMVNRQQQQQALVNRQQQQRAMANRQQQQQDMVNRQQQQQAMVNRQQLQQREAFARQQQQALMRRQATAGALAYPAGQQQPAASSAQFYRAPQPQSSNMNSQQTQGNANPSMPRNNPVRQKLIAFYNKYHDAFTKVSPHIGVFINAHEASRREAVKKQIVAVHTLLKLVHQPTIPPLVTVPLISQHALVIDKLINFFKAQIMRRNAAVAAAAKNPNGTATAPANAGANLRQQRLLQAQAQNQARLRAQQQAQMRAQAPTQQQVRARARVQPNPQAQVQAQQIQRTTHPRNSAAVSPTSNVQSPPRRTPTIAQPAPVKNLPVVNRNGAHGGITKPTKAENHAANVAKKAKFLNAIRVQAETILKRVDDTSKNAEKLLAYAIKQEKAMKLERVRNTLQALQRMAIVKKKMNAAKTDDGTVVKQKTSFVFSTEGGMEVPREEEPDRDSLRGMVDADCRAAKSRNALLDLEISEEFGFPVIECQLLIEEIKLPKLILQVKKGYPKSAAITYAFERPPLGWVGIVAEIHNQFKEELVQNLADGAAGVAPLLDAWARVAKEVVDAELGHLEES